MSEFTHEELQRVIMKYDQAHAQQRNATQEKLNEIGRLNERIEELEHAHNQEDIDMYKEEIKKLKGYIDEISNENEELKLARDIRDNEQVEEMMNNDDEFADGSPLLNNRIAQSL